MKHIACIFTIYSVIQDFSELLKNSLSEEVEVYALYDDFLVKDMAAKGAFTDNNYNRLRYDLKACELTGADLIVVSCCSISPAVLQLKEEFNVPIITADEAMMNAAVNLGEHIGLLCTNTTTIKPSTASILMAAKKADKEIDLQVLCDVHAIQALNSGKRELHDDIVLQLAGRFKDRDVIVIAQASAAHMEQAVQKQTGITTISSPALCIKQIDKMLVCSKEK